MYHAMPFNVSGSDKVDNALVMEHLESSGQFFAISHMLWHLTSGGPDRATEICTLSFQITHTENATFMLRTSFCFMIFNTIRKRRIKGVVKNILRDLPRGARVAFYLLSSFCKEYVKK